MRARPCPEVRREGRSRCAKAAAPNQQLALPILLLVTPHWNEPGDRPAAISHQYLVTVTDDVEERAETGLQLRD